MTSFPRRAHSWVGRNPYAVWLAGGGVYLLAMLHRASLGVAGPDAVERLHISSAQLGSFVMLQLGVYAAMQVPSGLAVDRWGPRRVLLLATVVMGLAQVGFAFATSFPAALAARGLLGAADSAVFLSLLRITATWFPHRRYPVMAMFSGMFGVVGNLLATVPLVLVLGQIGWVRTFAITGGVSIVYALLLLRPAVAAPYREVTGTSDAVRQGLLRQVGSTWRGGEHGPGTQVGFWTHQATMSGMTVLGMVWGYPYLTEGLGYSDEGAASMLTVLVLGNVLGGLVISPYAGRRRGSRMPLAIILCLAMVLAWVVLLGWPGGRPPGWAVVVTFAVIALGGPGSQIGFHLARDYNPVARIATATGLVNSGGFIGAMVGAIVVGLLLDWRSGDAASPTLSDYRFALAAVAAITVFSTVAMIISTLGLRRSVLLRMSLGHEVTVPVNAHWWDRPHMG